MSNIKELLVELVRTTKPYDYDDARLLTHINQLDVENVVAPIFGFIFENKFTEIFKHAQSFDGLILDRFDEKTLELLEDVKVAVGVQEQTDLQSYRDTLKMLSKPQNFYQQYKNEIGSDKDIAEQYFLINIVQPTKKVYLDSRALEEYFRFIPAAYAEFTNESAIRALFYVLRTDLWAEGNVAKYVPDYQDFENFIISLNGN